MHASSANGEASASETRLRLLTYNIHKGIGGRDRVYRLERTVEVIESQQPDIVCLQEVDRLVKRTNFDDQPAMLAARLGLTNSLYQLNHRIKRGGYGNLILARWPLSQWAQLSLRKGPRKMRGAQIAQIDTPRGGLLIVNWHLGLYERERRWQVRHLLGHHLFETTEDLPTMVIGDTNDWRNRLHHHCFRAEGFEHVTQPIRKFRTFPAAYPMGSLDKAFLRHSGTHRLVIRDAFPVRTEVSRHASDHLPLVIDIDIETQT